LSKAFNLHAIFLTKQHVLLCWFLLPILTINLAKSSQQFPLSDWLICHIIYLFIGETGVWTQVFMLGKQELFCFSHISVHSVPVIFLIGGESVLGTICSGWPQAMTLPISVSQITRIIVMSPWLFWTF
jgi:hypothetical protein